MSHILSFTRIKLFYQVKTHVLEANLKKTPTCSALFKILYSDVQCFIPKIFALMFL